MRRLLPLVILSVLVVACSDAPQEPASTPDLHAKLTAPPDLSGTLPQLERRVFIHYRPGYAKPEGKGKPKKDNGASQCFSLLAKGARWKTVEDYLTSVSPLVVGTWNDVQSDGFMFGNSVGGTIPPFDGELDGLNTAQLDFYPNENVIAVTVVWGIFIGPPQGRELVEWDILLNDQFSFGDAETNPALMDTENITGHELGHAAGLGHPPDECTEETMYAFASAGEIKKRDLEAGDIAGIRELY